MRVSARNVAVVAGLIAAAYLAAVFSIRRVPDGILRLMGGPTGIERDGGLVVRYRPPAGVDADRLERSMADRRIAVRREADRLVLELPGVKQGEVDDIEAVLTGGGLEFREVFEDESLAKVPLHRIGNEDYVAPGARLEYDSWLTEDTGRRMSSAYLRADRVEELSYAFAKLQAKGWSPPPHSIIGFEHEGPPGGLDPGASEPERRRGGPWRSHFLGEVLLDGDAVQSAMRSSDPDTGRPVVLLDFDGPGATRFAEITRRIVGHKLAVLVGGVVQVAPVINAPITGGRAVIWTGHDRSVAERRTGALVSVLQVGALPAGGTIEDSRWFPPAPLSGLLGRAVLLIALAGGVLVGGVVAAAIRVARPVWRPAVRRGSGGLPVWRLAVTLLAPVAVLALGHIIVPGPDEVELFHLLARGSGVDMSHFSIIALGVRPIVSAFIVVELATLVVGRWRRARLQPAARVVIGRWVAALGLAFALVQSYLFVEYLRAIPNVMESGAALRLAAILSLPAGTILLVLVAGVIRQHGLGNGYGAVLASTWAIHAIGGGLGGPAASRALGLVTLVAIGAATVAVLRMRIGSDALVPALASGSIPLSTASVVAAPWIFAAIGLGGIWWSAPWSPDPSRVGWALLIAVAALVPVWSFAFARPAIAASLARRAGLAPPGRSSWWQATVLSLVVLVAVVAAFMLSAATDARTVALAEPAGAMLLVAVVLDVVDDLRARRGALAVAWPLHQVQHAELVRRALADAGIACHLSAGNLRTLLAVFGAYVPIDVLVPVDAVDAARSRIASLYPDLADAASG